MRAYYQFLEYLKRHFDYISKNDAILEAKRLGYKVTMREVCQICNELYEW